MCGPLVVGQDRIWELLEEQYGRATVQRVMERLYEISAKYWGLLHGEISEEEFWQIFFSEKHWPFGKDTAIDLVSEALKPATPGTLDLLKSIVTYPTDSYWFQKIKTGAPPEVYITSDFPLERIPEVQRLHPEIFDFVTDTYWSSEMGVSKDDPEFFERVLWDLRIPPNEALFIDNSQENIKVASDIGIAGILFTDVEHLRKCLTRHGFEFADKKAKKP